MGIACTHAWNIVPAGGDNPQRPPFFISATGVLTLSNAQSRYLRSECYLRERARRREKNRSHACMHAPSLRDGVLFTRARSFYHYRPPICIIVDTMRYKENTAAKKIAKVQLVRMDSRVNDSGRRSGASDVAKCLAVACYPLMHCILNFASPEGHSKN